MKKEVHNDIYDEYVRQYVIQYNLTIDIEKMIKDFKKAMKG